MKRSIITKKELQSIQRYFNQIGGFGGYTESDCEYYSESVGFSRIGVIHVVSNEKIDELYFNEFTTIDEIKAQARAYGLSWRV